MVESDLSTAGHLPQRFEQDPPPQGRGLGGKTGRVDLDAVRVEGRERRQPRLAQLIQPKTILPHQPRCPGDGRTGRATACPVQLGQDDVAHPIARVGQVVIGLILDPGLATARQIRPEVGAGHVEQRPDDGSAAGIDPAQPSQPGASRELQEKRLGLVILRVSDGHHPGADRDRCPLQEFVSQAACCIFEREPLRGSMDPDIDRLDRNRQIERRGQRTAEGLVTYRARAKLMVEMRQAGDSESAMLGQFQQEQCERDGVRPARDTDEQSASGWQQAMLPDGPPDVLVEACQGMEKRMVPKGRLELPTPRL